MANTLDKNTIHVDAIGELTTKSSKLYTVIVSATGANAVVVLGDSSSNKKKCDLRVATSGESKQFDFGEKPLLFGDGIEVLTLTNAVVTIVYTQG